MVVMTRGEMSQRGLLSKLLTAGTEEIVVVRTSRSAGDIFCMR